MNINVVLFICETLVIFGSVVALHKFLGKEGLLVWAGIAPIMANLMTIKNISLFGMNCTCGSILFASMFLCTDILTECYSEKDARKAVYIGFITSILFVISSQICLAYLPSEIDTMHSMLKSIFMLNIRVTGASLFAYLLSNLFDVKLFSFLKRKSNNKLLWVRNNVCTILCNCLENFIFFALAYLGIMPLSIILSIAIATSILEIIIAILDTPFIYLAKKIKK